MKNFTTLSLPVLVERESKIGLKLGVGFKGGFTQ